MQQGSTNGHESRLRSPNGSAAGAWEGTLTENVPAPVLSSVHNARVGFNLIADVTQIRRGDVIVFSEGLCRHGHIGFADSDYSPLTISCYSQNQGGTNGRGQEAAFSVATYPSRHLLGAFRYRAWNTQNFQGGDTTMSTNRGLIALEIGHRRPESGAVGGGLRESDLNLEAGLECKRQLERHGFIVFTNRTSWDGIPLTDFYARAAGSNPVIGCAIHWNAGGGNGFETYTQTNSMRAESVKLNQAIADEMTSITILRPQAVRNFDTHPAPNGANITRLINSVPAPFAYTENGFIDNATDRARFDTPEKQRRYGVQIARGILKYLGISWISETVPSAPLFRVQCGAFREEANAIRLRDELRRAGYSDAFIVRS
jgi:N-acetylmuramoyl-L-alanine amidase